MGELLRSDLFRFLAGALLLGTAALTRIAAPNEFLWKVSVAATEGGHWLALAALLPAIPRGGQRGLGKLGGFMSLAACALFVFPLYHAQKMNTELPAKLNSTFG